MPQGSTSASGQPDAPQPEDGWLDAADAEADGRWVDASNLAAVDAWGSAPLEPARPKFDPRCAYLAADAAAAEAASPPEPAPPAAARRPLLTDATASAGGALRAHSGVVAPGTAGGPANPEPGSSSEQAGKPGQQPDASRAAALSESTSSGAGAAVVQGGGREGEGERLEEAGLLARPGSERGRAGAGGAEEMPWRCKAVESGNAGGGLGLGLVGPNPSLRAPCGSSPAGREAGEVLKDAGEGVNGSAVAPDMESAGSGDEPSAATPRGGDTANALGAVGMLRLASLGGLAVGLDGNPALTLDGNPAMTLGGDDFGKRGALRLVAYGDEDGDSRSGVDEEDEGQTQTVNSLLKFAEPSSRCTSRLNMVCSTPKAHTL